MQIRGFGLNAIRPLVALAAVAALMVGAAGPVAAAPAPTAGGTTAYFNIGGPGGIVTGPDGNLWFTNGSNDTIGKITPAGVLSLIAALATSASRTRSSPGRTATSGLPTTAGAPAT